MSFISFAYLVFLPLVLALYWVFPPYANRARTYLLLVASYVFYGWWDWRFLGLIAFSSLVDYAIGLRLSSESWLRGRKMLVASSLLVNLGLLVTFKYYDFFVASLQAALASAGITANLETLNLILPVGISFYTFQTLSYTLDIYKGKLHPERHLPTFFAYVAFFPQLVAGPIERAINLLPQFRQRHPFDPGLFSEGLKQILWGLVKKVAIADVCANVVNEVYGNPDAYSTVSLWVAAVCFAFQIYGDFSGYSDIAIGTAKLFGYRLMVNFKFPYFSRDIAEFWRRWHISLSTWFRDYLYIPLGGSRGSKTMQLRNVMIIFLVSGLWHGANWTFIVWGGIHGVLFLPLLLTGTNRKYVEDARLFPPFTQWLQMAVTFGLVTIAWVFFRAADLPTALQYIGLLLNWEPGLYPVYAIDALIAIIILVGIEWFRRGQEFPLKHFAAPIWLRWLSYAVMIVWVISRLSVSQSQFIYFQF